MKTWGAFLFALLLSVPCLAADEAPFRAAVDADGVQRVALTAGEFFFRPRHIVVKANVPVELSVKKEGFIVPHTIVMNEPEGGMVFNESLSGDAKTIRFVPLKAGRYVFFCDKKPPLLKSHRDRGMEGVLEVVDGAGE